MVAFKMAAPNTPTTTTTTNSTGDKSSSELRHNPAFKKLAVIVLSFIPAFFVLSIINVIFTHAFVLSSYLSTSAAAAIIGGGDNAVGEPTNKRAAKQKTVYYYVSPTQEDLDKILIELESSEPLPDTTIHYYVGEKSATKRVQTVIASLQSLMKQQRTTGVDTALKDMGELTEAYESFGKRFDEDIAHYHTTANNNNNNNNNNAEEEEATTTTLVLEHLSQFMKRKSLLDLDRNAMMDLFEDVIEDVNVLLNDDVLLRNSNQALMKLLNSKTSSNNGGSSSSSCDSVFLDLAKGNPTPELETVAASAAAAAAAAATKESTTQKTVHDDAIITKDTARESDLYERIESIKEILSRRELSAGGNKNHNPIDDEGVAEIRSEVYTMALILLENRQAALAHEKELRQHLMEETSSLASSIESNQEDEDDTDNAMCASPVMVEKMVHRGLDSIRSQADLQSALITTVFTILADESSEHGEFKQIMDALDKEMKDIDVPRIDFDKKSSAVDEDDESKNRPLKSGKKKTFSYVVDGPLLHQGIAGGIDSFVELISGYNDRIDEFLDYIMSRQGVSVGTATAEAVSNFIRKVPLPEVDRLRQSGILGGRIRSLVEE